MQNPESAPQNTTETPAPERIKVPDWGDASTQPMDVPVFEAPATPEPIEVSHEPIDDVKIQRLTIIDPEGKKDTTVLEFGRQGGLHGTEVSRVVERQPAPNAMKAHRLSAALRKLFRKEPKTPEEK